MEWQVPCRDSVGRNREVVVVVVDGRVSVRVPPGESFSLDADQALSLAFIVQAASTHAS